MHFRVVLSIGTGHIHSPQRQVAIGSQTVLCALAPSDKARAPPHIVPLSTIPQRSTAHRRRRSSRTRFVTALHDSALMSPFIGSDALAAGSLTRGQLRWNYEAVLPDVYVPKGTTLDLATRTRAASIWARGRAIVTGRSAAAQYVHLAAGPDVPVELLTTARSSHPGVITRNERIAVDEIAARGNLLVATPARTALDIARHLDRGTAMPYLDALARASRLTVADALGLADRYRRARGVQRARESLWLMDGGAVSPEESRLRMLLIEGGLPLPQTDITVGSEDEACRIPIGWERVKVGVVFHDHPPHPGAATARLNWYQRVQLHGWLIVTVIPQHHRTQAVRAVREALNSRRPGPRRNP